MSQPPGAPPEKWEQRKDHVSRKVIERMDRLAASLEKFVTWERLSFILGAAAVVIVGAAWGVTTMAASTALAEARDARQEAAQAVTQTRAVIAEDVRQVRQETSTKIERIEAKTDAIYKLLVEQKPRAVVRAEAEQRTGE